MFSHATWEEVLWQMHSLARAAMIIKYHRLGSLNNRNLFPYLWVSKVPNQGVSRPGSPWGLSSWFMQTCSVAPSCLTLCDLVDVVCQASLSMELSLEEYWGGLPFSPPGDLPDPGIRPASPVSPAVAVGFFTTEPPGNLPPWRRWLPSPCVRTPSSLCVCLCSNFLFLWENQLYCIRVHADDLFLT